MNKIKFAGLGWEGPTGQIARIREGIQELGHEINVAKEIKFTPGALEKSWIKNCYAVGLSANFVEPLEATSIGTSISQAYLLANYLINYDENTIEFVNKQVNSIMDNIRDFVFLHYLTDRDDTKFWQDVKKIEMPESLKEKMKLWKNRLPYAEDFSSQSDYCLFWDRNFTLVMYGLGLINRDSLRQIVGKTNKMFLNNVNDIIEVEEGNLDFAIQNNELITHKEYLKAIRGE